MRKKTICIIFGGISVEHEVSIISANSILNNIDLKKYRPVGLYLTKKGIFKNCKIITKSGKKQFSPQGYLISFKPGAKKPIEINKNMSIEVDVFFPIIHGTGGEDGSIQGLIKILDRPFIGCDMLGSAITMNKILTKELVKKEGINITKYEIIENSLSDKKIKMIKKNIGFPCFVKAANLGSSIGVYKANNEKELKLNIKKSLNFTNNVFVEEAVINAAEIEVSALQVKEKIFTSTPGEIEPSSEFYDYNAKYIDNKSRLKIPIEIFKNEKMISKIKTLSAITFKVLNCEGMARIDFLYGSTINKSSKKLYLSEVNSIPGFTEISMFPKLLEHDGIKYGSVIHELIQYAIYRYKKEKKLAKSLI